MQGQLQIILLTKRIKLQLKRYRILKSMQNSGFEEIFTEFIEFFVITTS